MNITGIITVRLSSKRLPNKPLMVIENKTLLEYLVARVSLAKSLNDLVIATTKNPRDKNIIDLARKKKWKLFIGDENNVLKRLINVGTKYRSSNIVRITGDNIFTDPKIIDLMVKNHVTTIADYTVTSHLPLGVTAEVIKLSALKKLKTVASNDLEVQEHVTFYMRKHKEIFKVNILEAPADLRRPKYRLTVDYPEDIKVIKEIFHHFYGKSKSNNQIITLKEIIRFLDLHPDVVQLNARVDHPYADFQK